MSINAAGVSPVGLFARAAQEISDRLWVARLARRTRRELNRLDSHMLADLGIARGDIDTVVQDLIGQAMVKRAAERSSTSDYRLFGRAAIVNWGTSARTAHLHA